MPIVITTDATPNDRTITSRDPAAPVRPDESSTPTAGPPGDGPPTSDHHGTPRGRRRWPIYAGGAIVLAGAAAAGVTALGDVDSGSSDSDEPIRLRAVTAETRDLVETSTLDGTMQFADVRTVTAGAEGVVTAEPTVDTVLERGDAIHEVDGEPVTVLYGDTPLYRSIGPDTVGEDVEMLERNLAALGYHVDGDDEDGNPVDTGFVVDGVYDDATADAVARWHDDLGIDRSDVQDPTEGGAGQSGVVLPSDVVVVSGPTRVLDSSVEVGDTVARGAPIADLVPVDDVSDGPTFATAGVVELFVSAGDDIVSGDVIASIDEVPVTAIVVDPAAEIEFDRELSDGVDDGGDVRALEEMLLSLGYDGDGDLDVDDTFDEATEVAVTEWQEDLLDTFDGVDVSGSVEPADFLVFEVGEPGDAVIGDLLVADDEVVASGTLMWASSDSATSRLVATSIAVADQQQLAVGNQVDVEFPDGSIVAGTVVDVATSSTVDPTDPTADPELAVEISLTSVPESAESLTEVDVDVLVVDEIAEGVTVVPVTALVAVGDGTYTVQTVDATGATQFVAVEPGMFDDGVVEVSGIPAGTQVVVPA
ncbi:MAG: peptidoglycan-binding domain-containing protein [Actinomycetota bacterium]